MALQFGISLPQGWPMDLASIPDPIEAYETMTRVAQAAEELGFGSIWLCDHFHTIPQPAQELTFECWTSTAALARDTRRIRIGQLVTCAAYRSPALLAKMASTVDVLSHGRLTLGIGAGWHEHEYRAYGYEYPPTAERLARLRDTVQVLRAMWTQEQAQFEGQYYQVRGAINQPKGVQQPHIPILIGGGGERVTLRMVAQYGDACNIGGDIATIRQKLAVLKQHCDELGRDYASIRRTVSCVCAVDDSDEQARAHIPGWALNSVIGQGALVGTPDTLRARLAELEEAGVQELIMWFPDAVQLEPLRRFAREFIG